MSTVSIPFSSHQSPLMIARRLLGHLIQNTQFNLLLDNLDGRIKEDTDLLASQLPGTQDCVVYLQVSSADTWVLKLERVKGVVTAEPVQILKASVTSWPLDLKPIVPSVDHLETEQTGDETANDDDDEHEADDGFHHFVL